MAVNPGIKKSYAEQFREGVWEAAKEAPKEVLKDKLQDGIKVIADPCRQPDLGKDCSRKNKRQ